MVLSQIISSFFSFQNVKEVFAANSVTNVCNSQSIFIFFWLELNLSYLFHREWEYNVMYK